MSIGQLFTKAGVFAAATALAATPALADGHEEVPSINNGAVSFTLGADVVTSYVFRGFDLEDSDFILQPYAEASFSITDNVDYYIGIWNSIHSNETGNAGANDEIFETDFYTGVSLGYFDPFTIDIAFIHYLFPNNNFGDYKEIDVTFAFDDSELLGDNAINPYLLVAFEFDTTSAGDTDDVYFEIGGEWSTTLIESADYPVDLAIPVAVGLSADDFFTDFNPTTGLGGDNEVFGFVSVGFFLSTPLSFIPAEYGSWSTTGGLNVIFLNGDVEALNDGTSDVLFVGSLGIALEY